MTIFSAFFMSTRARFRGKRIHPRPRTESLLPDFLSTRYCMAHYGMSVAELLVIGRYNNEASVFFEIFIVIEEFFTAKSKKSKK
jgi:hypothetical protein